MMNGTTRNGITKARRNSSQSADIRDYFHYDDTAWLLMDSDRNVYPEISVSWWTYLTDPNCRPYKYIIAILVSFIEGVLSYCNDIPGGIQSTIIHVMKISNTQYNLMFSAFKWPDIFMSFIGCVLVNKFLGIRRGLLIFLTINLIGQTLISAGAYVNNFPTMVLGRAILGSGFGTTISILNSLLVLWFAGKEIAFVVAISCCMCRLGATTALNLLQIIYNQLTFLQSPFTRLGTTQVVGSVLGVVGLVIALMVILLDWRGAKLVGRKPYVKVSINISDIRKFPLSFWCVVLMCSVYYGISNSFTANGPLFFVSKFAFSKETANLANSLSYASIIIFTPFIALIVDFYGYNLVWGLMGILCAITSHALYLASTNTQYIVPYLTATVSSFSFTFFATSMWVAPGYLVPRYQVTTAYGIVMSAMALSVTVISIAVGVIVDFQGYMVLFVFYLLLLSLIFTVCLCLMVFEFFSKSKALNVSGKIRREKFNIGR